MLNPTSNIIVKVQMFAFLVNYIVTAEPISIKFDTLIDYDLDASKTASGH